jgi:serine/threonine-protein kinase
MRVCPRCRQNYPTSERFCDRDNMVLVETIDIERIGTTVGNYHLQQILGRGGMGTVYSGEHVYIKKRVAVKVLHRQFAKYEEAVHRFLREARAASSINHPNIVDVTDFGPLDDGGVYFVMEYLEGSSLEDMIEKEGSIELHRSLNIGNQIALALAAAHEKNIVHRDLKPDNIMLIKKPGRRDVVRTLSAEDDADTGQFVIEREDVYDFVKVLDFGIAKVIVPDELLPSQTIAGAVFGTPEYMSPEAARGEDVDSRADIYSLGVILFDMVCGRPPFEAQAAAEVLAMHINKEPPVPSEFAPHREITPFADKLLLRALAKDPGERYQTMDELRVDLQRCYGSVAYKRNAAESIPGLPKQGPEARSKRLTEELDEWLQSDQPSLSLSEARMLAVIGHANTEFSQPMTASDEARLEAALEAALDDDD